MHQVQFFRLFLFIVMLNAANFNCKAQSITSSQFHTYRIQYDTFTWQMYEANKYNVYCEKGANDLLRTAIKYLPDIVSQIEDSLQLQFEKKVHIILFNSLSHRHQTNIGQLFEQSNPGTEIQFNANRILVNYKGSQQELIKDIRYELSSYAVEQAIYGNDFKNKLSSINKQEYPMWLVKGICSQLSNSWSEENDLTLKRFLFTGKVKNFAHVVDFNETLAGSAFCFFLKACYGSQAFSKFLFQLRSLHNTDKALMTTYKNKRTFLQQSTLAFFAARYNVDLNSQDSIATNQILLSKKISSKRNVILENCLKINATNSLLFYIEQRDNTFKLFAENLSKNENTRRNLLLTFPKVSHEAQNPMLILDPQKPQQGMVFYENKGKIQVQRFVVNKQGALQSSSSFSIKGLDGISNVCYGKQVHSLFLVGFIDGQSDLFEYHIQKQNLIQITDDRYDENSIFYEPEVGLLYCTTNPTDSIFWNHEKDTIVNQKQIQVLSNAQIINLQQRINKFELVQSYPLLEKEHVRTMNFNATHDSLFFISNRNGIDNLYAMNLKQMEFDSTTIVQSLSNSQYAISDYTKNKNGVLYATNMLDSFVVFFQTIDKEKIKTNETIYKQGFLEYAMSKDSIKWNGPKKAENTFPFFEPDSNEVNQFNKDKQLEKELIIEKIKPYKLQLTSDYISGQIDNSLLLNQYQPFFESKGIFRQAVLGGLMKYSFSDLFEDHVINLGIRIPSTAQGSDFYFQYANFKKRIDWGITYFRHSEKYVSVSDSAWRSQSTVYYPPYVKQKVHYLEVKFTYPFSHNHGITFSIANRYDKHIFIATDTISLRYPDTTQLWNIVKLEYQLDKTKQPIPFVREGYRAKLFAEVQNRLSNNGNGFIHVGMDIRNYVPIYKHIVWANRLSASTSGGGTNGIMYTLGGTNNWIGARVDSSVVFQPSDNYSFISIANNLRGYAQNIRFGNTFVLWNSELRIPILNTFYNHHFLLNSLNNLQFVPFVDLGNAWKSPLLSSNKVPSWALGYGVGLRTTLVDYFVRVDLAKTNRTQINQKKSLIMVALGREF